MLVKASHMELLLEIVKGWMQLTIFTKNFILDLSQGSNFVSEQA